MFSIVNTSCSSRCLIRRAAARATRSRDAAESTGPRLARRLPRSPPRNTGYGEISAYELGDTSLSEPGQPAEVVRALRVTSNLFSVLRVQPQLGRDFLPHEETPGNDRVVLLSQRALAKPIRRQNRRHRPHHSRRRRTARNHRRSAGLDERLAASRRVRFLPPARARSAEGRRSPQHNPAHHRPTRDQTERTPSRSR